MEAGDGQNVWWGASWSGYENHSEAGFVRSSVLMKMVLFQGVGSPIYGVCSAEGSDKRRGVITSAPPSGGQKRLKVQSLQPIETATCFRVGHA